jgi:hypothetical protein
MQINLLKISLLLFITNFCILNISLSQSDTVYDIVLSGGRVIDPETKLDAIKNVGIINNRIMQISSFPLKGKENLNVAGLVVSPGFIDLHVHGRDNKVQEYQMHDGVTTALELEFGIENLNEWLAGRESKAIINYGASVNWPFERFKSIEKYKESYKQSIQNTLAGDSNLENLFKTISPSYTDRLNQEEIQKTNRKHKTILKCRWYRHWNSCGLSSQNKS